MDVIKVKHNKNDYAVVPIKHKTYKLPLVLSWNDYEEICELKKKWKYNYNGFVSSTHAVNETRSELFIHELILYLRDNKKYKKYPIHHINRIGLDNRRENLEYIDKVKRRNTIKKKRTINLPKDCDVDVNKIPTYVWYSKPHGTHGERFIVEIGDVSWKTTASKKITLKDKLKQAKDYLKTLKINRPDLFDEYCMNGEFNKRGKSLTREYFRIIKKAGYNNLEEFDIEGITDSYLN